MPQLRRVLILSASYGEGHQQAALAVRDALIELQPGVDVRIVDYLEMVHPMLNSFARYAYLKSVRFAPALYGLFYNGTSRIAPSSLLQRRLNHLGLDDLEAYLREYSPDAVLSTFPTPAGVMSLLKERGLTSIPNATVITDHAIHNQWIHKCTDHYFVGSELVKKGLVQRGVPPERITTTGIPIRPAFLAPSNQAAIRAKLGLDERRPTVLIMGGAYGVLGDIVQICEELFQSENLGQMIVVCGRNEKLRVQIDLLAREARNPVWVFGFTREVHELMAVSNLIVTKAGGLTISEALAMELPMLLYRPIPGQETQNAAFLVKSRVAVLARTRKEVVTHVHRLLYDGGSRLKRMRQNTNTIRKVTAARDIAYGLEEVAHCPPVEGTMPYSDHALAEES